MKKIGLTTYGIDVREGEHKLELHNILGKAFMDIIEEEANNNLNVYSDDIGSEQIFTFDTISRNLIKNEENQDIYEILFLRVKTGEYGIESEIIDKETGAISYNKKAVEADIFPFGCCIMIPCGVYASGVIILQSTGNNGIKKIISRKLDEYIKKINQNYRCFMGTIVPKVYMENYLNNGILQSIRLIRYKMPDDVADSYGIDRGIKGMVEERVIKKPRGFIRRNIDSIKSCMNGDKRYDEIIQIENFEIDDLKLDFRMGSRTKTISMRNLDNLIAVDDVTNDVILENGNPNFDSLCKVMQETGEFYLRAKGLIS